MRDTIGKIWIKARIATTLQYVVKYLQSQLEKYRLYVDVLHIQIEWLLYCWKCLFSKLELDARTNGELRIQTRTQSPSAW